MLLKFIYLIRYFISLETTIRNYILKIAIFRIIKLVLMEEPLPLFKANILIIILLLIKIQPVVVGYYLFVFYLLK